MRIVRWWLIGLWLACPRPAAAAPGLQDQLGVLVDDTGTVVTAYHCVASGRRPTVTARDGTEARGRVLRTAPRDDLAVLEVPELAGHPFLSLREAPAEQGEEVWALGHPSGLLRWSVSRGIVSAVGERLIQVDAPVNPGNSGGPVVDADGRILGITSRKLRADNIGFLAPSSAVRALLDSEDRPFPIGGSYGAHAVALMPVDFGTAPSLGLGVHVAFRDTFVFTAHGAYALGVNWMAAELGRARWTGLEVLGAARVRVGRGRFSTSLDAGGGLAVTFGRTGAVEDGQLDLRSEPAGLHPLVYARAELFGVGVRVSEVRHGPGDWALVVALETGLGGPLGTF